MTVYVVRASDYSYADNERAREHFSPRVPWFVNRRRDDMSRRANHLNKSAFVLIAVILIAGAARITPSQNRDSKKAAEAAKEAQKAADAFTEIMNVPEKA